MLNCRFKGSKKQSCIFFREKEKDYDSIAQCKDKINIRIIEHTHVVLAHTSAPTLPWLEVLLFHPEFCLRKWGDNKFPSGPR